jgi:four helix bundle protein
MTIHFPKEERFSLIDQIRRSSRSVAANLAEAYGKRCYPKHFRSKLTDSIAENFETQTWLDFALEFDYIAKDTHQRYTEAAEEVGKLLSYMERNSGRYVARPLKD